MEMGPVFYCTLQAGLDDLTLQLDIREQSD